MKLIVRKAKYNMIEYNKHILAYYDFLDTPPNPLLIEGE